MTQEQQIRRFKPGSRIITEGETSSDIFILLSGELAVWRGRVELGRLSGKGDVIGELAAFTKRQRAATVVAVTDVELLTVTVDLKGFSRRVPDAIEKIDATIIMRYEIARTKARRYAECAAIGRRRTLTKVLLENELSRKGQKVATPDLRKTIRRRLDDSVTQQMDADDPRFMKKLADEYSVLTDYMRELSANPWLDENIALRLEEVENRFRLHSSDHSRDAIRERANATAEILDILGEYESLPGMLRQVMLMRLESLVPMEARISTLRTMVAQKMAEFDDQTKLFNERKVMLAIEKEKINAGKDPVLLYPAAEELSVGMEYETEIKRLAALSESSSSLVDAPPI